MASLKKKIKTKRKKKNGGENEKRLVVLGMGGMRGERKMESG